MKCRSLHSKVVKSIRIYIHYILNTHTQDKMPKMHWLDFNLHKNQCNSILAGYVCMVWWGCTNATFKSIHLSDSVHVKQQKQHTNKTVHTAKLDLWENICFNHSFLSSAREREKNTSILLHKYTLTLSSVDVLRIKSHLSTDCIEISGSSKTKKKIGDQKYEKRVHAITLIYMIRAGSRIVFNNNSPTCNAFRMNESSVCLLLLRTSIVPVFSFGPASKL